MEPPNARFFPDNLLESLVPLGLWMAYWYFLVDWKSLRPVLARGGWLPALVLGYFAALFWSRIVPGPCTFFGLFPLENFWGHLLVVYCIFLLAGISGLLQSSLGHSLTTQANSARTKSE